MNNTITKKELGAEDLILMETVVYAIQQSEYFKDVLKNFRKMNLKLDGNSLNDDLVIALLMTSHRVTWKVVENLWPLISKRALVGEVNEILNRMDKMQYKTPLLSNPEQKEQINEKIRNK